MKSIHPKKYQTRLGVAVAVASLLAASCGSAGDDGAEEAPLAEGESVTLRYATFAPAASFPGVQMEEWADLLAERTGGLVTVELFPGSTLLETGDIYDGVSQGVVDVGLDSPAYDAGRFPFASVVALPLGFPDARAASLTLLDLIDEYQPDELSGFEVITAFTAEPGRIQTKEPVTSQQDLAGMELRAAGAAVPVLQALGATPVGMPMPDVAEALRTGAIDGYHASREVLQDFGLAEQVSYVTEYALGPSTTFIAVMDAEAFDSLPADVQDVIRELRSEMATFAADYHDGENVASSIAWATAEHGVEILELDEDERLAWDRALEDVIDAWLAEADAAGLPAQKILDRALELRDLHARS